MTVHVYIVMGVMSHECSDVLYATKSKKKAELFKESCHKHDGVKPTYPSLDESDSEFESKQTAMDKWSAAHPANCSLYDFYHILKEELK